MTEYESSNPSQSFIRAGQLVIVESDSIDGAQASGRWIRGKPTQVTQ